MVHIDTEHYEKVFPKYPVPIRCPKTGWLHGTFLIGADFRNRKSYYGEYPPNFLKRVAALIPNPSNVLHLFSGTVEKGSWPDAAETMFDINADLEPDVVGDAHHLSQYFTQDTFDLVVADPPYSSEDSKHYGTPMISRNKVIAELYSVVQPGGLICWLDQVFPMYRKAEIKLIGTIGIYRSTNHRFRALSIFEKL